MHVTAPRGSPSRRGRPPRSSGGSPIPAAAPGPLQTSKLAATFTSSLHIPVEGAIPIDSDIPEESPPSHFNDTSQQQPLAESKRAPRKSKTEALAALHNHTQSSSTSNDDLMAVDDATPFLSDSSPIPVSLELDLNTVRTSSPRVLPARAQPRPFGLENCLVFYPSVDAFKDPMTYIRSISGTAKNYGLCKIVPPEGWKMPFVTDTAVGTR